MTTFAAMLADIYTLTNRPDLVAETSLALRKATMKCHSADLWKNDLTSAAITLPVITADSEYSYRYSLDLTAGATFPLYRKVNSIKELNNPLTGYEIELTELDVDRVLDDYQLESINYWYQAGQQVQLRANKLLVAVTVNYWKYPDCTTATYNSWIANQFPDMIVEEAAGAIFKIIGKDTEAQAMRGNFAENIQMLTMTQI